jgi:hypothetical protein
MRALKIIKWLLYIILLGAAILDGEGRQIYAIAFFTIASVFSGFEITNREKEL